MHHEDCRFTDHEMQDLTEFAKLMLPDERERSILMIGKMIIALTMTRAFTWPIMFNPDNKSLRELGLSKSVSDSFEILKSLLHNLASPESMVQVAQILKDLITKFTSKGQAGLE